MANWCLIREQADKFIKGLRSGEIDALKLSEFPSSEARHKYLSEFVGEENATQVNSLFEAKLGLKNQQLGYINWVKNVIGIKGKITAEELVNLIKDPQKLDSFLKNQNPATKDIIYKISRLKEILKPKEGEAFKADLVETKLGTRVSAEEAQKIADLSAKIDEAKLNVTDTKSRVEYGNKILDLYDYTDSLSESKLNLGGKVVNIANAPRSLMSSLDFSAPFRQGFGMVAQPKQFASAFKNMFKYAVSEKAYKNLMADIITRDTYDQMKSGGLRIVKLNEKLSQREEAFMSNLLDKVPGIKQSERAYTGFLNKLRADVFDKYIKQAELNGEDVSKNSQVTKDIASTVNDFTGSGNIGKNDQFGSAVPLLNSIFFSPRKISATINIFNPVHYMKLSPTARGLAIRNLVGMLGVSAAALSLAKLNGAKVTTDPKSSDFGKAVLGNTHIDVTGGNANYLVLLARLATGKTTSTTTGISKDLKPGFGSTTRGDILVNYIRNKLSPTASFVADFLYGKDAIGNPFSVKSEVASRVTPLVIQDIISSVKTDPEHAMLSAILDTFGAGVQVYTPTAPKAKSGAKSVQYGGAKTTSSSTKKVNPAYQ